MQADPGFLDRGRQFGRGGHQFGWEGGGGRHAGQTAQRSVNGNLKNRLSLSKIGGARLLRPPPGPATGQCLPEQHSTGQPPPPVRCPLL